MNRASGPDPWANNRHAVRPQAAKSSVPNRDEVRGPGRMTSGAWGSRDTQSSAPRSWSAGTASVQKRQLVGPPYAYLWISFSAAVVALGLALLSSGLILFVIGWVIAGFIGFGAAVIFVQRDALRQVEVFYLRDPRAPWLYRTAIVLSLLAVVATAVRVALVLGRMG